MCFVFHNVSGEDMFEVADSDIRIFKLAVFNKTERKIESPYYKCDIICDITSLEDFHEIEVESDFPMEVDMFPVSCYNASISHGIHAYLEENAYMNRELMSIVMNTALMIHTKFGMFSDIVSSVVVLKGFIRKGTRFIRKRGEFYGGIDIFECVADSMVYDKVMTIKEFEECIPSYK